MNCTRHALGVDYERHAWARRVTHTETLLFHRTDMWGRVLPVDQVLCHTEHVCRDCGEVRHVSSCSCEPERAEVCAVRLAWLSGVAAQSEARA